MPEEVYFKPRASTARIQKRLKTDYQKIDIDGERFFVIFGGKDNIHGFGYNTKGELGSKKLEEVKKYFDNFNYDYPITFEVIISNYKIRFVDIGYDRNNDIHTKGYNERYDVLKSIVGADAVVDLCIVPTIISNDNLKETLYRPIKFGYNYGSDILIHPRAKEDSYLVVGEYVEKKVVRHTIPKIKYDKDTFAKLDGYFRTTYKTPEALNMELEKAKKESPNWDTDKIYEVDTHTNIPYYLVGTFDKDRVVKIFGKIRKTDVTCKKLEFTGYSESDTYQLLDSIRMDDDEVKSLKIYNYVYLVLCGPCKITGKSLANVRLYDVARVMTHQDVKLECKSLILDELPTKERSKHINTLNNTDTTQLLHTIMNRLPYNLASQYNLERLLDTIKAPSSDRKRSLSDVSDSDDDDEHENTMAKKQKV